MFVVCISHVTVNYKSLQNDPQAPPRERDQEHDSHAQAEKDAGNRGVLAPTQVCAYVYVHLLYTIMVSGRISYVCKLKDNKHRLCGHVYVTYHVHQLAFKASLYQFYVHVRTA